LGQILEDQAGDLLDDGSSGDLANCRRGLTETMREVRALLPKIQAAMNGSDFGMDALKRAEQTLTQGEQVLRGNSISAIAGSTDQLTRTLNLFKGWLQRIGTPAS
jgi:hypothetical protein